MSAKLIVTDKGDSSVGIFPQEWIVDSPFSDNLSKEEIKEASDDLEFFRKSIIDVYKEYAQGKITADYDFEIKAMNEENQNDVTENFVGKMINKKLSLG